MQAPDYLDTAWNLFEMLVGQLPELLFPSGLQFLGIESEVRGE